MQSIESVPNRDIMVRFNVYIYIFYEIDRHVMYNIS